MSTNKFCLIGHPLEHSISPQIHKRLFELSGCKGEYTLNHINPEQFDDEIANLKSYNGFNATIPYKQRLIPFLDEISPRAKKYGAVNTVKNDGGKLYGFNTDVEGFLRSLETAQIELKGNVLLCGAGGVARMMACEALDNGCTLTIATPTIEEAQGCINDLLKVYPDANITADRLYALNSGFDLIVNGTPNGMYPNVESCPVSKTVVLSSKAVFDAIYNPSETLLLKYAKAAGAKVQGGLKMLVWQAAAAQEIWTSAKFKANDIENLCKEMSDIIEKKF
jgi:shikimate dehydrogenase